MSNKNNIQNIKKAIAAANDADKQRLTTYLAYIAVVLIAILSSSLNLLFDLSNFDAKKYAISVCFNIAFGVVALLLSLKDGRLSNETRRKGELYETKQEFKKQSSFIVDDDSFRQWNDELYEKEKLDYIKTELSKINITDLDYLKLNDKQLKTLLTEEIEFNNKALDKINEDQLETIKKYRDGKFVYKKLPYTFFKSEFNENEYKQYADIEGTNKKIELYAYVYRIAMIVMVPAILGLAVVNPTSAGAKTIAYDMVSRVTNVCTSIFLGYSLAHDESRRLINSLIYKIEKIKQYLVDLETGIFVPKSRDEIQIQKLTKIREKRKEEAAMVEVEMSKEELNNYTKGGQINA